LVRADVNVYCWVRSKRSYAALILVLGTKAALVFSSKGAMIRGIYKSKLIPPRRVPIFCPFPINCSSRPAYAVALQSSAPLKKFRLRQLTENSLPVVLSDRVRPDTSNRMDFFCVGVR